MENDLCRGCIVVCLSEKPSFDFLSLVEGLKGECSGLDSHYLALLTDSVFDTNSTVCNTWLRVMHSSATATNTPAVSPPSIRPHLQSMTWEDLASQLATTGASDITRRKRDDISNEIHYLLDHLPWGSDDYVLMNVAVFISASSMSASTELYGALLRLRTWNNATLYFICEENDKKGALPTEDGEEPTWKELSDCLPAYIGPLTTVIQNISDPYIWKGLMRVPEQKTKYSQTPSALALPGYVLSFPEQVESIPKSLFIATGMNIGHTHHPSHLELVRVVDIRDIPLIWVSPLTVRLSIDPAFVSSPSGILFKEVFQSSSAPSTGVLLRLYMRGGSGEHRTQHETSTDQWRLHILEKELPSGIIPFSAVSNTLSDYPGPLLLALPHSDPVCLKYPKSCIARLLWKQTAMDNVAETLKKILSVKKRRKERESTGPSNDEMLSDGVVQEEPHCAIMDCFQLYTRKMFLSDVSKLKKHELLEVPSQWPEIMALHNLESMLKKQIKRKNTSELTLAGMTAPPPTGTSSLPTTTDLLECFTDSGMPKSDLSPVAMNDSDNREDSRPLHMIDPVSSSLTYNKLLDTTPTTSRKYHGVSYCFTEEDSSRDAKLTKVQKRYVSSERSCNCSNYQTPMKNQELKNRKKLAKAKRISKELESNLHSESNKPAEAQTDTTSPQTHTGPSNPNQPEMNSRPAEAQTDTTSPQTHTGPSNPDQPETNSRPTQFRLNAEDEPGTGHHRPALTRTSTNCHAPPQLDTKSQSDHSASNLNSRVSLPSEKCQVLASEGISCSQSGSRSRKGRKCKDPIRSIQIEELKGECCHGDMYRRLKLSKARRSLNVSEREVKHHQGGVASSSQNTGLCKTSLSLVDQEDKNDSVEKGPMVTGSSKGKALNTRPHSTNLGISEKHTVANISSLKEASGDLNIDGASSEQELIQPFSLADTSSGLAGTDEDNQCPVTNNSPNPDKLVRPLGALNQISADGSSKNLKKMLERSIASSLKSHGMKRGHQCFKSCYIRLFKITKVFVKDLKPNPSKNIKEQINKIVEFNVQQVIDFELSNQTIQETDKT